MSHNVRVALYLEDVRQMDQAGPNAEDMQKAVAFLMETAVEMFLEDGLPFQEAEAKARLLVNSQPLIEFPEIDI